MHKKTLLFLIVGSVLIFAFSRCDTINPEEDIPHLFYVKAIELSTHPSEGTDDHKITDVWVFQNSTLLGVFPLPTAVPLYGSGESDILFLPGIRENGIQSVARSFTFFERIDLSRTLIPGQVDSLGTLITTYVSNADFSLIEDFEAGHSLKVDADDDGDLQFSLINDGFEGRAGKMDIDTIHPIVSIANQGLLTLPINGTDVYLEMNYKNDIDFQVGLIGHLGNGQTAQEPVITLFPRADWNKIYINLGPTLFASQLNEYQIFFRAILPIKDGVFSVDEAEVFLDNVKLVHF